MNALKEFKNMVKENNSAYAIIYNCFLAAVSLFINGLGVYLTIHANIGAGPWDVLNLGISKTFGLLYGNVNVAVSFTILALDVLMKEPIGLAMIIDAITVGKAVDFFNYINIIPVPKTVFGGVVMMIVGLFIIGSTQYTYMAASLGCGPRDTLLVALKKRITTIPIGVVSIGLFVLVTVVGYLLGGQVGVGTIIMVLLAGPIMQLCFEVMHFDATKIKHQNIKESLAIIFKK